MGGVPIVLGGENRRSATRADVVNGTRLLDSLQNVSTITPHFTPQDVPPEKRALWMFLDAAANTTKPVRAPGTHTAEHIKILAEMVDIAFP